VVTQNQRNNFKILQIKTSGDNKVNFYIKNKLSFNSNDQQTSPIILEIISTKKKAIKEKNIKNEITKYQVTISVKVKLNLIEKGVINEFSVSDSNDYDVGDIHSQTLRNEKKTTRLLTENITDDLINKVVLVINDN
tara:strand:+ start:1155 stop:1562 length:408 start_codon:yes stop_codon:yes gene_type:complete